MRRNYDPYNPTMPEWRRCIQCNTLKTHDRFDDAVEAKGTSTEICKKCKYHPVPSGGIPAIKNCHSCQWKLPRRFFGGRRHSHFPECQRYTKCDFCEAKAEDARWTKKQEEKRSAELEAQKETERLWWEKNAARVEQWVRECSFDGIVEKLEAGGRQREAAEIRATPPWADPKKIDAIYEEAARITRETGMPHHVDHIVPLQGPIAKSGPFKGMRIVFGLHCEANLRVIPARENVVKGNREWPDMPEEEQARRIRA